MLFELTPSIFLLASPRLKLGTLVGTDDRSKRLYTGTAFTIVIIRVEIQKEAGSLCHVTTAIRLGIIMLGKCHA